MQSIKEFLLKYPTIQTKRLIIRPFRYDDVDDLYEIFSSKKTTKYIQTFHESKKVTKRDLAQRIKNIHNSMIRDWALENENHKLIGIIRMKFSFKKKEIEFAYVLNEQEWRKGYGYEACLKMLYYCFQNYDVNCITAEVRSSNIPALNLLGRLGFEYEYTDRSFFFSPVTEHYKMTKEKFHLTVEVK